MSKQSRKIDRTYAARIAELEAEGRSEEARAMAALHEANRREAERRKQLRKGAKAR